MSDTFNMIVLMDWGTETLRWTAGSEELTMPNIAVSPSKHEPVCAVGNDAIQLLKVHPEYCVLMPPAGILFDDPEAMAAQRLTMIRLAGKTYAGFTAAIGKHCLLRCPGSVCRGLKTGGDSLGLSGILQIGA